MWTSIVSAHTTLMKKYHGTTMVQPWYTTVYHGKQWYTMVWCKCSMVQITCTMVNRGIPWYNFSCTMAHPYGTMVQRTCTMVHYGIPWYIVSIPWYILAQLKYNLLVPWYAMEYDGTSSYHHSTNFLHCGMLWFTMVQSLWKYTIVHQILEYHDIIYHAFIIVYFGSIYPLMDLHHVKFCNICTYIKYCIVR